MSASEATTSTRSPSCVVLSGMVKRAPRFVAVCVAADDVEQQLIL